MSDIDGWVPTDEPTEPDIVASKGDPDVPAAHARPAWHRWAAPVGLLAAGGLVGGVLAATLTAGADTSPKPAPGAAAPGYGQGYGFGGPAHGDGPGRPGAPGRHGLDQAGTVTAVGTDSVTIKTSAATTKYAVTSMSDIDKNGEAKLSDLKVGDAVHFNAATIGGKPTIVVLHAGNEALNRPQHGPGDGDHMRGPQPAPGSSTSGTGYDT
jgi:hypothetical protein